MILVFRAGVTATISWKKSTVASGPIPPSTPMIRSGILVTHLKLNSRRRTVARSIRSGSGAKPMPEIPAPGWSPKESL